MTYGHLILKDDALPVTATPPLLSRLGLGCYALGGGYGLVDESAAKATVDEALELGWSLVDTAESYRDAETRLGRILRGRRDRVFLATKVFPTEAYSSANLRSALEGSLRRLQTDRVDLYQLHGPENWVREIPLTPPEELAAALLELLDSSMVLHVGLSNFPLELAEALRRLVPIFSTQDLYSLYDRENEETLLPWASEHGIVFIAYSPLSRGLLGDTITARRSFSRHDERHFLPRFREPIYGEYVRVSSELRAFAAEHDHTLAELAVAWTLHNPAVTSTLVGAKTPDHVRRVAAASRWRLDNSDLREVESIVATLPDWARATPYAVWDHLDEVVAHLPARTLPSSDSRCR